MSNNSGSSEPILCHTASAAETRAVGAAFAGVLRAGDLVVLSGDLGSGKTTFVSGVGVGLGAEERATSPTFTIVRELHGRLLMRHVDLYRLDRVREVEDLGLGEMVEGDGIVLVEWGDVIRPLLGDELCEIHIEYPPRDGGECERTIEVRLSGPSWASRAGEMREALATVARGGGV